VLCVLLVRFSSIGDILLTTPLVRALRRRHPDSRLVFTWAWHSTPERVSLVTVTVTKDGDTTMLTLQHEQFVDQKAREGHERGWAGTLEKLARFFAGSSGGA